MFFISFGSWGGLKGKLVSWLTKSPWHHVWIEYDDFNWNGRVAIHSTSGGVQIHPIERVLEGDIKRVDSFRAEVYLGKGLGGVRTLLGTRYDYASLFYNLFLLLLFKVYSGVMKVFRRDVGVGGFLKPRKDIEKMTCSEFVALVLKRNYLPGTFDWEPEFITPGELYEFLEGSSMFTKVELHVIE